jgi:hypothetical protein
MVFRVWELIVMTLALAVGLAGLLYGVWQHREAAKDRPAVSYVVETEPRLGTGGGSDWSLGPSGFDVWSASLALAQLPSGEASATPGEADVLDRMVPLLDELEFGWATAVLVFNKGRATANDLRISMNFYLPSGLPRLVDTWPPTEGCGLIAEETESAYFGTVDSKTLVIGCDRLPPGQFVQVRVAMPQHLAADELADIVHPGDIAALAGALRAASECLAPSLDVGIAVSSGSGGAVRSSPPWVMVSSREAVAVDSSPRPHIDLPPVELTIAALRAECTATGTVGPSLSWPR